MDRGFAAKIMQAAIILHNMIVEVRRAGYESEPYKLAEVAADRGYILNEKGDKQGSKWNTQCNVWRGSADPSETRRTMHVGKVDSRKKYLVLHHAFTLDLICDIWGMYGNSY